MRQDNHYEVSNIFVLLNKDAIYATCEVKKENDNNNICYKLKSTWTRISQSATGILPEITAMLKRHTAYVLCVISV